MKASSTSTRGNPDLRRRAVAQEDDQSSRVEPTGSVCSLLFRSALWLDCQIGRTVHELLAFIDSTYRQRGKLQQITPAATPAPFAGSSVAALNISQEVLADDVQHLILVCEDVL